jgi:hypothetical protein
MSRPRIKKEKIPVISLNADKVLSREPKEITRHHSDVIAKAKAYEKRHNDFIACGGTRILNTFSDNVAAQIAAFRQSRLSVSM